MSKYAVTSGVQAAPVKTVLYGPEGIGKSTFASHFPSPVFIDTEGGTKRLNVGHSEIVLLFESMNDAPGCGILDGTGKPRPKACERYIALMDAMEADGYEPDEDEQAIYQKATDCMEATK